MDAKEFTETNHPALYYQDMLADRVRMGRYREAIGQVVRPGDVVADLGTGLGVLALMAAQAGAARVYAVENRPQVVPIAERVVRANPGGDRVRLVEGDAREVRLEEPVDVIVNELIGDFGTDENIHECVAAFARRNLRPDGKVLPSRLTSYLAPVEYRDEFRGVWRDGCHGLDLRAAVDFPFRPGPVMYGLRNRPKELADRHVVEDVVFGPRMGERSERVNLAYVAKRAGTLQGFVGFFDATLADEIRISNYPCYPLCHWVNWNWPVSPPVAVEPGVTIEGALHARANMVAAGWMLDWALGGAPGLGARPAGRRAT